MLPVNHVVQDGRIAFRTTPGSKLGVAATGSRVAIEVDGYDPETHTGWSAVAYGTAVIVTDRERLDALHALNFDAWTAPDLRDFWVEIDPDRITGRRIEP